MTGQVQQPPTQPIRYTYSAPIQIPTPAGRFPTGKYMGCDVGGVLGFYEYNDEYKNYSVEYKKAGVVGTPKRHFEPYKNAYYNEKDFAEMRIPHLWVCRSVTK